MKFNAYILEKYGMTKERRWENMSESERECEECNNNLVGDGIPQGFIDQIFGD